MRLPCIGVLLLLQAMGMPAFGADPEAERQAANLIGRLGEDAFAAREQASRDLLELSKRHPQEVYRALQRTVAGDTEMRARIDAILDRPLFWADRGIRAWTPGEILAGKAPAERRILCRGYVGGLVKSESEKGGYLWHSPLSVAFLRDADRVSGERLSIAAEGLDRLEAVSFSEVVASVEIDRKGNSIRAVVRSAELWETKIDAGAAPVPMARLLSDPALHGKEVLVIGYLNLYGSSVPGGGVLLTPREWKGPPDGVKRGCGAYVQPFSNLQTRWGEIRSGPMRMLGVYVGSDDRWPGWFHARTFEPATDAELEKAARTAPDGSPE